MIVNDRADIALIARADGVHLGQDDLPPAAARGILGGDAVIGYSTHSAEQAVAALREPVDYIAAGPIFATGTKEQPDPVIGLEGLRAIRQSIGRFPLVAIGGIDIRNIRDVLAVGADSAAVISAVLSGRENITEAMKEFNHFVSN